MNVPEMNYCMHCGARLQMRHHSEEGRAVPYCPDCAEYRFPVFNTGVSMIVTNPSRSRILLIRQYGGTEYILCAGYVNKGEDAESAAVREVKEELGFDVSDIRFNRSHYYAPSNTLMFNFTVTVSGDDAHPNAEIDSWSWFSVEEARQNIRRNSLAQAFLNGYLDGIYTFPEQPAKPYR